MDALVSWVKQIFIISIISNIVVHLMPTDKQEKYAKFICGIILAVACIAPVISLLNGKTTFAESYHAIVNNQDMQDLKAELKYAESDDKDALISSYEKKVAGQIEEKALEYSLYPSKVSVVIDSDANSETYGSIQTINMNVSLTKKQEDQITIEDVNIGKIIVDKPGEEKNKSPGKKSENSNVNKLKDYLSDFYNLELSNINININGA